MNEYQALQFRRKLTTSLDEVKLILDRQRAQGISAADATPHRFEDKFLLVNQVTNSLGISIYASLAAVGFSQEKLATVKHWAQNSSVSFRIVKDSVCTFVKEATRKEESARSVEVEYSLGLLAGKSTTKVVNAITEFFYNYEVSYRIEAFRGMGIQPEDILEITSRTSRMECITRTQSFPFPESSSTSNEVNVSWFIRNLQIDGPSSSVNFDFQINREDEKRCRTATRNPQVEEAIAAMVTLRGWCQSAHQYFSETVRSAMQRFQNEAYSKLDTSLWSSENVFVPILPIFRDAEAVAEEVEDSSALTTTAAASEEVTEVGQKRKRVDPVVDGADIGALLDGHAAALSRKLVTLSDSFPAPNQLQNNLISSQEAHLIVVLNHIVDIIDMHRQCMDFMEEMLRTQIIAAIGREITPTDFDKYMQFHYRKLYREEFAPRPWSLSVRRTPKHAPEGTVRIEVERSASDGGWQPIDTFSKSWASDEVPTMTFPISAATTIAFKGSRHVHGYLSHAFQAPRTSASRLQLRLVAAARQFSSFMVVLGRISSATSFDPKHAFIVENKEEMFIPLQGETIPSAKEFRDAIASLSPAQQRFAKAYRAMQLESTLFGVLLIQIKPPMERVLRLHPDSLTKEIKLSQDLSKMFLEYQISSDLMCCEDELADAEGENAVPANRLRQVQENVRRVQEMIEAQIKAEVEEANLARAYEGAPSDPFAQMAQPQMHMAQPRNAIHTSAFAFGAPMPPPAPAAMMMRGAAAASTTTTSYKATVFDSAGAPPPPAPAASSSGGVAGSKAPTTTPQYGAPEPSESDEVTVDITKYPVALDAAFDELDPHQHAVRPTILHTGATWQFVKQKPLAVTAGSNGTASAAAPPKTIVNEAMQGRHRNKAYDLLDAITRSGGLTLEDCELHVVIAATHAFDRSLMNTLVQANENPIEDVERSSAILASTLHALPPQQLVLPSHGQRLVTMHPQLLLRK